MTDRLPSDLPWKEFWVETKWLFLVNRRAVLRAPSIASVPLLQKKVRFRSPGLTSARRRPASAVIGLTRYWLCSGMRSICALTARTTSGCLCPRLKMPYPPRQSMNSSP